MAETNLNQLVITILITLVVTLIVKYLELFQDKIGQIFKNIRPNLAAELKKITGYDFLLEKAEKPEKIFMQKYDDTSLLTPRMIFELYTLFDYPKRLRFKILLNYCVVLFFCAFILLLRSYDSYGILSFEINGENSFFIIIKYVFHLSIYLLLGYKLFQILILHISERTLKSLFEINGIDVFNTNLVWFKK